MKRLGLISLLVVFFVSFGSAASADTPTVFLKTKLEKLGKLFKDADKNKTAIYNNIDKLLDFDAICKDSLGKYWDTTEETKRADFCKTLQDVIKKNLFSSMKDSSTKSTTYESEKVTGKSAEVVTIVTSIDDPRADSTQIVYKLHKKGSSWKTTDMITEDNSLVENYRSMFNKIITKDGWDALVAKLKKKLAE